MAMLAQQVRRKFISKSHLLVSQSFKGFCNIMTATWPCWPSKCAVKNMSVNHFKEWLDLNRMEGHVAMLVQQVRIEKYVSQSFKGVARFKQNGGPRGHAGVASV